MSEDLSVYDLDLSPPFGKEYFNCSRELREEFIYFLLVDRFSDGTPRTPVASSERSQGSGTEQQLGRFCGGKLKGITQNLGYIRDLGCSAIWLSPIFENNGAPDPNSDKYHGYSIQNYLAIDPRFGTEQDLVSLVAEAHKKDMRVFLDVVLNHSGDNWQYPNDDAYYYWQDWQYPLGKFRLGNRPLPKELQNERFYHRRGQIRNWDADPEFQRGDFFSLKDFNNDETPDGVALIDVMIRSHCYWIKQTDVDGFRLDAVKHMGAGCVGRFCSAVYEYARLLGKRNFVTFGELIATDNAINRYVGPNTAFGDKQNLYTGMTSVLDFPLSFVLPNVIKGLAPPSQLVQRYDALRDHALTRGELGRYLVTFLDNHDAVGMDPKRRFGADAPDDQIIAGVGTLMCLLGASCIYYGTEQGFSGKGSSDANIREAMFDLNNPGRSLLNQNCRIYKQIAEIAKQFSTLRELKYGRIYFREISGNGYDFGLPQGQPCTLAFSRLLADSEVLVAYNTSVTDARNDYVVVDSLIQSKHSSMRVLYSNRRAAGGNIPLRKDAGTCSVQLSLQPMEFVILR
jgi:glycosidase